jgi:hypothetical protein
MLTVSKFLEENALSTNTTNKASPEELSKVEMQIERRIK